MANYSKKSEVIGEVNKALKFEPLLSEYYIVTTAPDDTKLQRLALRLSVSASKERQIDLNVRVWGWNTMEREIRRHTQAIQAFAPPHSPHGDHLERKIDDLPDNIVNALKGSNLYHYPAASVSTKHIEVDELIGGYVDLISSSPNTALELFQNSMIVLATKQTAPFGSKLKPILPLAKSSWEKKKTPHKLSFLLLISTLKTQKQLQIKHLVFCFRMTGPHSRSLQKPTYRYTPTMQISLHTISRV